MAPIITTPYSNASAYTQALPSWVSEYDAQRLAAYTFYENTYFNVRDTFRLKMRGSDSDPIYIPNGKVIVEATNRFLAKGWDFSVNPTVGTDEDRNVLQLAFTKLFKRENLYTKFATQRRFGLIRGDAVWHIVANPSKPVGSRLSVHELDPASYFPIYEEDDLDRLVGCHIVDQIQDGDKTVIRRQTYRKVLTGGTQRISSALALFELGNWDDREESSQEIKLVRNLVPEFLLPPEITQLPVYHVKNGRVPGDPFGSSELRGIEVLMTGVNQIISDGALSLALDGLGMYATTSGPPTDEDGNETNWILGPGRVVEIDEEASWNRVSGVSSMQPVLELAEYLSNKMLQASGVPDIAAGSVDVTTAESGIALSLKLAPILAKNEEKEAEMIGVYDQMFYDIATQWMRAYDAVVVDAENVQVDCIVGDPFPVNRESRIAELLQLKAAGIVSAEYVRVKLSEYGYDDIPDDMQAEITEETQSAAEAADPFGSRAAQEALLGAGNEEPVA